MERKEVRKLANRLEMESGIDSDSLYTWLMECGKSKSKNPILLKYKAGQNIVFIEGERDNFCIEKFSPKSNSKINCSNYDLADYWENKILARQEKYMD